MSPSTIEAVPEAIEETDDRDIKVPNIDIEQHDAEIDLVKSVPAADIGGATMINAVQLVWGKHGKKILIAG